MMFSIAAERLINRDIISKPVKLPLASLFPFFNMEGKVQQVMLILQSSDNIYLIPQEQDLIQIDLLGRIHLKIDLESLSHFRRFSETSLKGLYHFDPYWVLKAPKFRSHWALDLLKQSNCVNRFPKPAIFATYTRDLLKLKKIIIDSGSHYHYLRSAKIEEMDTSVKSSPLKAITKGPDLPTSQSTGWHLDPIWNQKSFLSKVSGE